MSIDGKTQFMKNCIYIAGKYQLSYTELGFFLGIYHQEKGLTEHKWPYELNFRKISSGEKDTSEFMPTYDEAGKLSHLAGVELFEVFSRSLKRLDELGELPQ